MNCDVCGGPLDASVASEDGDVGEWCPACVDYRGPIHPTGEDEEGAED